MKVQFVRNDIMAPRNFWASDIVEALFTKNLDYWVLDSFWPLKDMSYLCSDPGNT